MSTDTLTRPSLPLPLQLAVIDEPRPDDARDFAELARIRAGAFYDDEAQINVGDDGAPIVEAGQQGSNVPPPTVSRWDPTAT